MSIGLRSLRTAFNSSRRTASRYDGHRYHNPWPSFTEKSLLDRLVDLHHLFTQPRASPLYPGTFGPLQQAKFSAEFRGFGREEKLDVQALLPLMDPKWAMLLEQGHSATSTGVTFTWIGHSTCLVQMGPLTLLTDPWFTPRPSALQFIGPKRIRPSACTIDQLPPLDVILISHNHFDHLDYTSCRQLVQKMTRQEQNTSRRAHWFVPQRLSRRLIRWCGVKPENITELDWWDQAQSCSHYRTPYQVTAVPAQHWSSRYALIDNRWDLWCSFVIEHDDKRFYFAGDTGMCSVFEEIGDEFKRIDLSAIPIGAYSPRWLLKGAHVQPSESVQIHQHVKSEKSIAIHWGTVILSDEMVMEPKFELERCVQAVGLPANAFHTTKHGETVFVP